MKTSIATTRGSFFQTIGLGAAALELMVPAHAAEKPIAGFEKAAADASTHQGWKPVSDRKIRVGIAGYGFCKFGMSFGFQDHANVQVVAVSDLIPERCAGLGKDCRCDKTYPSLEEMVKDDSIEAVFVATDAPSHARDCIEVLKHGKHVATAVPAVFGSLDDAEPLLEAVKSSGKKYGLEKNLPPLERPPLPPGVQGGYHGGSHGPLMNEFITAIPEDRQPLVDVIAALNMSVAGIVAHQSALKDDELLKVPQYKL